MAIIDVLKYNGNPDVFAWKYPSEELGTWTQLIVGESQEAVLFKGGRALDVFQSGRHTLETANIPLLNTLINLPFGGRSPFTAEVWYINKIYSLDIRWGTPTPIQLQDPKYKVFIPVRSYGQFGITIENSKQFLLKLVGALPVFDKATLTSYFKGLYLTKVRDAISTYLVHKQISIMDMNAYLDELSDHLQEKIQPMMAEYGIRLANFYVNDISVPEEDPAVRQLKGALAKRAEMDIIGYNYQQQRSFDTLEGAAKNTSSPSAGLMNAGIGLGMGTVVGNAMGGRLAAITKELDVQQKDARTCPKCKTALETEKRFCADCGYDTLHGDEEPVHCCSCHASFAPTMKYCPHCGAKYVPCPKCGASLSEGSVACTNCGHGAAKPCPSCGVALLDTNARFCSACGQMLVQFCPGCHGRIEGSPNFCAKCGHKFSL